MKSPTLTFGKFKGRTLKSLLNTPEGISYVRWLAAWQAANTSNTTKGQKTMTTMTPENSGAEDLTVQIEDEQRNTDREASEIAREILAARGHGEPDEALINAVGRAWILVEQCGVEDTDANWETHGLPWCERYNAGYWAAAQAIVEDNS